MRTTLRVLSSIIDPLHHFVWKQQQEPERKAREAKNVDNSSTSPNPICAAPLEDSWRTEVASRLNSYRAKRKRSLAGQFCMRFDASGEPMQPGTSSPVFRTESATVQAAVLESPEPFPATGFEEDLPAEAGILTAPVYPEIQETPVPEPSLPDPEPVVARYPITFRRKIVMEPNVIEFPRLFPDAAVPQQTLAEPIADACPRILDAPEIAGPLIEVPMFENMRLGGAQTEPEPAKIEVPIQVATVSHRVYASVIDAVIVLAGTAVFISIATKMMPSLQWSKPMVGALAAVPLALWWIYQYVFLVYNGRTIGMQMTGTVLSTLDGRRPAVRERRKRAIGMLLSCVSLALGFLWALFDEDELCWHDRISGTYVRTAGERAFPSA